MRSRLPPLCVTLACAALAACAPSPRPAQYSYWRKPAHAAPSYPIYIRDKLDGSYQGTAYLTSAPNLDERHYWHRPHISDQTCPRTNKGTVEVADRTLYYSFSPTLVFTVPVADDGTFSQTVKTDAGTSSLTGRIRYGGMRFAIVTPSCTSRFFGSFDGNHS